MARKPRPTEASAEPPRPPGLVVERVPIDSLRPHPENRRKHPEESIAAIAASLSAFTQVEPLVVQKSTGYIIAGEGRWLAMKRLGYESCDIAPYDCTDDVAKRLMLVLNRTAEMSEWDEAVSADIAAMLESGVDEADLRFLLEDLAREMESGQPLPDATAGEGEPAGPDPMELRPHEHYDYVLVVCNTTNQWHTLLDALGIEPRAEAAPRGKRVGCGRAITAAKLLERIHG